jgi:uncharacterized protein YndB with AHSA1/START domain
MPSFAASVVIDRPQRYVFDYLTDPSHLSEWTEEVQSAEWSSKGQPDVGSTMTARMGSRTPGGELQLEVTKWDPPTGYDERMLTPVFPLKAMRREYLFVPDGSRTRVTVNGEFTMVGGLRFASGWMQRRATSLNQQRLDAAKRVLEAG